MGSFYPLRMLKICGFENRCNDLIYCRPLVQGEILRTAVFFGGDVQDYTENMLAHRDNKKYLKWNLENTALILQKHFPDHNILVIKPSRMEYKTFSCFDNFVPSIANNCGAPDHRPVFNSLQHLYMLLKNVSGQLRTLSDPEICGLLVKTTLVKCDDSLKQENADCIPEITHPAIQEDCCLDWDRGNIFLENSKLSIIGFSKGCIVLNQFLYEFHYFKTLTPEDKHLGQFVPQITEMFWLDGGHSGGKNTWITSKPLLETFSRLNIKINIHVTPYQIEDDRRPWIKKEENAFFNTLTKFGAPVSRTVHFPTALPSLLLHFEVLNEFRINQ